jgi:hypothetical protein
LGGVDFERLLPQPGAASDQVHQHSDGHGSTTVTTASGAARSRRLEGAASESGETEAAASQTTEASAQNTAKKPRRYVCHELSLCAKGD